MSKRPAVTKFYLSVSPSWWKVDDFVPHSELALQAARRFAKAVREQFPGVRVQLSKDAYPAQTACPEATAKEVEAFISGMWTEVVRHSKKA